MTALVLMRKRKTRRLSPNAMGQRSHLALKSSLSTSFLCVVDSIWSMLTSISSLGKSLKDYRKVSKSNSNLFEGVKTSQIVDLCAETCAYMAIVHPDYTMLANKISVTELHKRTHSDIRLVAEKLYNFVDSCDRPAPLLEKRVFEIIMANADVINSRLDYSRDFNYDFFGFKTLEKAYLLRVENK